MMRLPPLWMSPFRDIYGFSRRYLLVGCAIAFLGSVVSVVADARGLQYLGSFLAMGMLAPPCNFSVVARLVLGLLVGMEVATIVAVLVFALFRRPSKLDGLKIKHIRVTLASLRKSAELVLVLLFLHLGAYAVAFHADDVCESTRIGVRLHHYAALFAFAALYSLGSIILIGIVSRGLRTKSDDLRS